MIEDNSFTRDCSQGLTFLFGNYRGFFEERDEKVVLQAALVGLSQRK